MTIGGLIFAIIVLFILAWAGRHDTTRRVRFGFFFEKNREGESENATSLDDHDAPTEIIPGRKEEK